MNITNRNKKNMEQIVLQPRIEGTNLIYDLRDAADASGFIDLNNVYINIPSIPDQIRSNESSESSESSESIVKDIFPLPSEIEINKWRKIMQSIKEEIPHDELNEYIGSNEFKPYGALKPCYQGEDYYFFYDKRCQNKPCKGRIVKHYDDIYLLFDYVIRFGKWDDGIGRHVIYRDLNLFTPEDDDEWIDTAAGIVLFTRPYDKDKPLIKRYFTIKYKESWRETYPDDDELPWTYLYNFEELANTKRDLHGDLIAELHHPRRIQKWIESGEEVEDYLH